MIKHPTDDMADIICEYWEMCPTVITLILQAEYKDVFLSVSEDCAKSVLSLPGHPAVTEKGCRYIADVFNKILYFFIRIY